MKPMIESALFHWSTDDVDREKARQAFDFLTAGDPKKEKMLEELLELQADTTRSDWDEIRSGEDS